MNLLILLAGVFIVSMIGTILGMVIIGLMAGEDKDKIEVRVLLVDENDNIVATSDKEVH